MKTLAAKIMGLALGISLFSAQALMAADVSKSDLARMEKQMAEQDAESKRLAKQAAEITEEVKTLSANIVKYAKVIQNNEDKIFVTPQELQQLKQEGNIAYDFTMVDNSYAYTKEALFSDKNTVFDSNDRRSRDIYVNFHGEKLLKNLEIVEALKKIASKHEKSVAAVAIRFILDYLPESVVLCGAKRSSQIMGNTEGAGWHLSQEEMNILDEISAS